MAFSADELVGVANKKMANTFGMTDRHTRHFTNQRE